jgi:hypothetical protein
LEGINFFGLSQFSVEVVNLSEMVYIGQQTKVMNQLDRKVHSARKAMRVAAKTKFQLVGKRIWNHNSTQVRKTLT